MKPASNYLILITSMIFLCLSCEIEKDKTPQELLEGKWNIVSSELLGTVIPGDGSYLKFNACNMQCTGEDYKASDNSTGTFTYTLNGDAVSITISDTLSAGGSYNATWDILELTETDFRMVGNTILGSLKIEMLKSN